MNSDHLKVGDIIVTDARWYIQTVATLFGMKYPHSAVYIGGGHIVQATIDNGVEIAALEDLIDDSDKYMVLRPTGVHFKSMLHVDLVADHIAFKYSFKKLLGTLMDAVIPGLSRILRLKKNEIVCTSYCCAVLDRISEGGFSAALGIKHFSEATPKHFEKSFMKKIRINR